MADRWVIAYDVDTVLAESASVTVQTIYNRIRACLSGRGFTEFTQLSVYAMEDADGALVRVYQAIQALTQLAERKYIKRLHVFKIDGALNDVLPIVDNRASAGPDN
jgi:virulence-associated protein VapD